jgi:hypothetical protein
MTASDTLTSRAIEGPIDGGVTGATNAGLVVDYLTDRIVGFAAVNMLDAARELCYISRRLICSITIVPRAIATDNNALEA